MNHCQGVQELRLQLRSTPNGSSDYALTDANLAVLGKIECVGKVEVDMRNVEEGSEAEAKMRQLAADKGG
jgi:hypothetical protein